MRLPTLHDPATLSSRLAHVLMLLLALSLPLAASSQQRLVSTDTAGSTPLSLDDAVAIALRRNPSYLKSRAQEDAASVQRLSALGQWLPQVSGSFGVGFQQGGSQFAYGTTLGPSSDILSSSYGLSIGLSVSAANFVGPRAARANIDAASAQLDAEGQAVRTAVTDQYLLALEADATVALQDTLIATAETQLELAQGKARVGTGTQLDVQLAQVTLAQKRVARIQALNQSAIQRVKLYEQMGVPAPAPRSPLVPLTTAFQVDSFSPPLDSLLALAHRANPSLNALRATARSTSSNLTLAYGRYLPSLSIGTGLYGYTSQFVDGNFPVQQALLSAQAAQVACDSTQAERSQLGLSSNLASCAALALTPAEVNAIRRGNNVFPFGFTRSPIGVSASLSLPIFDGFSREANLELARVARLQSRYDIQTRELALTSEVTQAYLTLTSAQETARLEAATTEQARTALGFVQQRYRVGLATFVDVAQARDTYENAESGRINAIYDYQKSLADLEGAVGRRLRTAVSHQ